MIEELGPTPALVLQLKLRPQLLTEGNNVSSSVWGRMVTQFVLGMTPGRAVVPYWPTGYTFVAGRLVASG